MHYWQNIIKVILLSLKSSAIKDLPVQMSGYYHLDIPFTVDIQKELLFKAGFDEVKVFHKNIKSTGSGAILVAKRYV